MKANKSSISKKEITTDNFPFDFYNRAFEILAYLYKSGPEQSTILPNPTDEITVKEENKYPFQSRIVDLRLRRNQDQRASIQKESNKIFSNEYKKYGKLIKNDNDDIISAFEVEQAVRPDIPLYLQNVIKDEKENSWKYRRKKRPNPMNMKKIEKEYTERLKTSEKTGINRAKRRYAQYHKLDTLPAEAEQNKEEA